MIDSFGRTVTVDGENYTVMQSDGSTFVVEAMSDDAALRTINAMAPAGWSRPPPTSISALAFLQRFTQIEQAAIWQAAVATPAIGIGLQQGLATGTIDLNSPVVAQWLAALVAANAVTQERATVILTP